jgi:hypothetical protein
MGFIGDGTHTIKALFAGRSRTGKIVKDQDAYFGKEVDDDHHKNGLSSPFLAIKMILFLLSRVLSFLPFCSVWVPVWLLGNPKKKRRKIP